MFTFDDAIQHALDYIGQNPSDAALRDARRSALMAQSELAISHLWTCYLARSRIVTSAPFSDGIVTIDPDQGTATLIGGTWPAWAPYGTLRVGQVDFAIKARTSDTVLSLPPDSPLVDGGIVGANFTLFRDAYPLPHDYYSQDVLAYEGNWGGMTFTRPRDWMAETRWGTGGGPPTRFTILSSRRGASSFEARVFPYPDRAATIDFIYKRRPAFMQVSGPSAGSVALSIGSRSVVGTGTTFMQALVGTVFRVSVNSLPPTGPEGLNPAAFEALIESVEDDTHLTLDTPAPYDMGPSPFVASSRLDLDEGSMLTAFLRGVEYQLSIARTIKDKPNARAQYFEALERARAADSRSFTPRSPGDSQRRHLSIHDFPSQPVTEG